MCIRQDSWLQRPETKSDWIQKKKKSVLERCQLAPEDTGKPENQVLEMGNNRGTMNDEVPGQGHTTGAAQLRCPWAPDPDPLEPPL